MHEQFQQQLKMLYMVLQHRKQSLSFAATLGHDKLLGSVGYPLAWLLSASNTTTKQVANYMVHTSYGFWCLRPEVPCVTGQRLKKHTNSDNICQSLLKAWVCYFRPQPAATFSETLIKWVWHMHVMWPYGVTCSCSATLGHSWSIQEEHEHVDLTMQCWWQY